MNKTWQIVIFLGIFGMLFTITQYITTIKSLEGQKEFQQASEKIRKEFDLQKVNIVRFQRPEEYRIIITPKVLFPEQEALEKMERVGLFFKKNAVPFSTIKIKVVCVKEVAQGCSSKTIKWEKTVAGRRSARSSDS